MRDFLLVVTANTNSHMLRARNRGSRHRAYCITNFIENEAKFDEYKAAVVAALPGWAMASAGQLERCPRTGRLHVQAYAAFTNARTLGAVKRVFGEQAHLEPARGTYSDNLRYCTKEESRVRPGWVWSAAGEWPVDQHPGRRGDLDAVMARIQEGASLDDIDAEFPGPAIRYHAGISAAITRHQRPRGRDRGAVRSWLVAGQPGTGKSRGFFELVDALDIDPRLVYRWTPEAPWEQYRTETVILMDDWDPGRGRLDRLLEWLDRYHTQVRVLYGTRWLRATRFIITSNYAFGDWYADAPQVRRQALERRLIDHYWCENHQDVLDAYEAIKLEWNE